MLMKNRRIDLEDYGIFELGGDLIRGELRRAVSTCIEAQKCAGAELFAKHQADKFALKRVSPAALDNILKQKIDIHGISSHRDISNDICFGFSHIEGAIIDDNVQRTRQQVDYLMGPLAQQIFNTWKDLAVKCSGVLWYPKGSAMGWHTNSTAPGWRLYINVADEEGESFFRYKVPGSSEIITLNDAKWNLRVFRLTDEEPLWHSVYSNTNRFSLGYRIGVPNFKGALLKKIRKVCGP